MQYSIDKHCCSARTVLYGKWGAGAPFSSASDNDPDPGSDRRGVLYCIVDAGPGSAQRAAAASSPLSAFRCPLSAFSPISVRVPISNYHILQVPKLSYHYYCTVQYEHEYRTALHCTALRCDATFNQPLSAHKAPLPFHVRPGMSADCRRNQLSFLYSGL